MRPSGACRVRSITVSQQGRRLPRSRSPSGGRAAPSHDPRDSGRLGRLRVSVRYRAPPASVGSAWFVPAGFGPLAPSPLAAGRHATWQAASVVRSVVRFSALRRAAALAPAPSRCPAPDGAPLEGSVAQLRLRKLPAGELGARVLRRSWRGRLRPHAVAGVRPRKRLSLRGVGDPEPLPCGGSASAAPPLGARPRCRLRPSPPPVHGLSMVDPFDRRNGLALAPAGWPPWRSATAVVAPGLRSAPPGRGSSRAMVAPRRPSGRCGSSLRGRPRRVRPRVPGVRLRRESHGCTPALALGSLAGRSPRGSGSTRRLAGGAVRIGQPGRRRLRRRRGPLRGAASLGHHPGHVRSGARHVARVQPQALRRPGRAGAGHAPPPFGFGRASGGWPAVLRGRRLPFRGDLVCRGCGVRPRAGRSGGRLAGPLPDAGHPGETEAGSNSEDEPKATRGGPGGESPSGQGDQREHLEGDRNAMGGAVNQ